MGTLDVKTSPGTLGDAMAQASCAKLRHSSGKPLPDDEEWQATPPAFRMPFLAVLKNAGYQPPEIALFHRRAQLAAAAASGGRAEQTRLLAELGALEQAIALRPKACA